MFAHGAEAAQNSQRNASALQYHFGGKDGLLAACYAAAYAPLMRAVAQDGSPPTLKELIEELLGDSHLSTEDMTIWLALWGEIAINPVLRAEHLRHYRTYRAAIAQATARHFGRDRPDATDDTLAIAPSEMSRERARAAVQVLLQGAGLKVD